MYPSFRDKLKRQLAGTTWFDAFSMGTFLLALVFPFLVISMFPGFYHSSDVNDFWIWSRSWDADWRTIYPACERCNYPFLGTFISAGVMSLSRIAAFDNIVQPFRYFLALFDAVNIYIIYLILKQLQVKSAHLWAGLIGVLPSFWVGTSVWGQIEGVGLTLILLIIRLFLVFNLEEKKTAARYYLFIGAVGLLISFSLLLKQLMVFSVLSIGLMAAANIFMYSRKPNVILSGFLLLGVSIVLPVFVVDINLHLPLPYFSHLQYILKTGSQHGDILTSYGFNIWMFLPVKQHWPSRQAVEFFQGSGFSFSIVPYDWGIALFVLTTIFFSVFVIRAMIRKYKAGLHFFDRQTMLLFLFHLCLVNLSFNLFLTGAHERYLYFFYPFLIILCLSLENPMKLFGRRLTFLAVFGTFSYGILLVSYLSGMVQTLGKYNSKIPFQVMVVFNLFLFGVLSFLFLKQVKVQRA